MPIYTYRCNDCDYQFEKRQRMSDAPLTECIHCQEGQVRRVVNSVGVVFKGSGFYVTDNRNGNGKAKTNGSTTTSTGNSEKTEKTTVAAETEKEPKSETKKEPAKVVE